MRLHPACGRSEIRDVPFSDLAALRENTGFTFAGEPAWPPSVLLARQTELLLAAPNPSGRPNADVIRAFVGVDADQTTQRWQIDFPPHHTEQEAALYVRPFATLRERTRTTHEWWINPHLNRPLREATARVERYLATPFAYTEPAWTWIEGAWLPDESLVVVVRDDDFTQAVLHSRVFGVWWEALHEESNPLHIVESFPFPWSPEKPLGALTALQQDLRYEASRTARAGDSLGIAEAVSKCYGWPTTLDQREILARLTELHRRRSASQAP